MSNDNAIPQVAEESAELEQLATRARAAANEIDLRDTKKPEPESSAAQMPPTIIHEPVDVHPDVIDLTDDAEAVEATEDNPSVEEEDERAASATAGAALVPTAATAVPASSSATLGLHSDLPVTDPSSTVSDDRGRFPIAVIVVAGLFVACLATLAIAVLNTGSEESPSNVATNAAADVSPVDSDDTIEAPATSTVIDASGRITIDPTLSMSEALEATGEATQFLRLTRALGFDGNFEAMSTASGVSVRRTLFAPTDEAFAKLSPARLNDLAVNLRSTEALIGYHLLEDELTAEQLVGTLGNPIVTQLGLRMNMGTDGDEILINGDTRIVVRNIQADNGIVHLIDTVLDPPTVNEEIGLENIEFVVDTSRITPAGENELRKALNFLREHNISITIEGHTDTDGSPALNLALSEARANAVRDFLIDNNIEADRLTAVGLGETQPILINEVENKGASRRIEFVVD